VKGVATLVSLCAKPKHMHSIPLYLSLAFSATTLVTVALFYKASNHSKITLFLLLGWLLVQGLIARTGFYTNTTSMPPRLLALLLPPLLFIIALFITPAGKRYLDGMDLKTLTLLHTIRIPVELVLLGLFIHHTIPKVMTFEGHNFDLLSGITAPVVYYFGFVKKRIGRTGLLLWNVVCLFLLINIVITAILSVPYSFQKLGLEQPNIAVLHFPFVWLACCVVPLVLLAHLAGIRQLLLKKKATTVSLNSEPTSSVISLQ
jgi:hypothetical protein